MRKSTLVLMPRELSRVIKIAFPSVFIDVFRWASFLFFLLTCYVIFQYVVYWKNVNSFQSMMTDYEFQEIKLQNILIKRNKESIQLAELVKFNDKLRLTLGSSGDAVSYFEKGIDVSQPSNLDRVNLSDKSFFKDNKIISLITEVSLKNITNLSNIKKSFSELQAYLLSYKDKLSSTPLIKPVRAGYLTSGYGLRGDPFLGVQRMHYGVDWAFLPYTPVYATADGVVERVYKSVSFGNVVLINHGNYIKTLYAHLAKSEDVAVGKKVKRGTIVARMGNSGKRSTGYHLHYEVWLKGKPVNPANYILEGLPVVTDQFSVEF
ncbi:MAG: M23 family metallopeptidase [SAR324 cluster bacterium]|nr:M23 family metallopeptidase [SAR324 cluster bacterium]